MHSPVSGLGTTLPHIANTVKEEKSVYGAEAHPAEPISRVSTTPSSASAAETAPQTAPTDLAVSFDNTLVELFDTRLSFNYDERIHRVVVRVLNNGTEEVIRQIPPEHLVDLLAKFQQDLRGLLLNQQG
jgi:flagellar protein FlaG